MVESMDMCPVDTDMHLLLLTIHPRMHIIIQSHYRTIHKRTPITSLSIPRITPHKHNIPPIHLNNFPAITQDQQSDTVHSIQLTLMRIRQGDMVHSIRLLPTLVDMQGNNLIRMLDRLGFLGRIFMNLTFVFIAYIYIVTVLIIFFLISLQLHFEELKIASKVRHVS